MKKITLLILSIILIATGCGRSKQEDGNKEVKIGVVGANNEYWQPTIDALAKEGVTIKLVEFSDYSQPNRALADNEIDLNSFQHKTFLKKDIEDHGYEIVAIGDTLIAPLGIYSNKYDTIEDIKDEDTIVIPNDPTNGGRALKVLEQAGLIKIDASKGYLPILTDITENKKNLKIVEMDASQTASQLNDPKVAAALINGGVAVDFGLLPNKDAIFTEKVEAGSDNPYVNVLVAKINDKDNEIYQKIVKAFQSEETKKELEKRYQGAYLAAW